MSVSTVEPRFTMEVPGEFDQEFDAAYRAAVADNDNSPIVPLAALRLALDQHAPEVFEAGLIELVTAKTWALVEMPRQNLSPVVEAGAIDLDGKAWFWCCSPPVWRW